MPEYAESSNVNSPVLLDTSTGKTNIHTYHWMATGNINNSRTTQQPKTFPRRVFVVEISQIFKFGLQTIQS